MYLHPKSIIFFGTNATATTNDTLSATTLLEPGNLALYTGFQEAKTGCQRCNVILNFNTITSASTGTIVASVQERFSDIGYVETAKSSTITATGQYVLARDAANATQVTNHWGNFPLLGLGTDKRIVFTNSTIQDVSVDVYFAFYSE